MSKEYVKREIFPPQASAEGNFIVFEDFEAPHLLTIDTDITDVNMGRVPSKARQGLYGYLIDSGATPGIDSYAGIGNEFCLGRSPYLNMEIELWVGDKSGEPIYDFNYQVPTMKDMYESHSAVRIKTSNNEVSVRTGASTWEKVGTLKTMKEERWLYIYFEVNRYTNKYNKVLVNEQEFDASGLSAYITATVDNSKIWKVKGTTTVDAQWNISLDHILIRTASS